MKIIDIQCTNEECKSVKEVFVKFGDVELPKCERCGATVRKLVNSVGGVNLKGDGFYKEGFSR